MISAKHAVYGFAAVIVFFVVLSFTNSDYYYPPAPEEAELYSLVGLATVPGFAQPPNTFSIAPESVELTPESHVTFTVESTDVLTYYLGYYWVGGNGWVPIELRGDLLGGAWLLDEARGTFTLSATQLLGQEDRGIIAVYSCGLTDDGWACPPTWHLHQFDIFWTCGQDQCIADAQCYERSQVHPQNEFDVCIDGSWVRLPLGPPAVETVSAN